MEQALKEESFPEESIEVDIQNDEIMSLKSINVDLVTGDIDFDLQSKSHNVFIGSNLNFIKQYIDEKRIFMRYLRSCLK